MRVRKEMRVNKPKASPKMKQPKKTKKLVLFDFDGTITTKDTLFEFLRFYKGTLGLLMGLWVTFPMLTLYGFKLIPNWKAKQSLLKFFIGGEKLTEFNAHCREFSNRILPKLIRPKALHIIEQYLRDQATVVVVSASAENWVAPWCELHGVTYLATQLEVKNGKLTGNFCGENCFGPEKAKRIQAHLNLSDYDEIIAYGDSVGDKEMLALAHQKFYKPFRD